MSRAFGPLRARSLSNDDFTPKTPTNVPSTPTLATLTQRIQDSNFSGGIRARSANRSSRASTPDHRGRVRTPFATAQLLAEWQKKNHAESSEPSVSPVILTRSSVVEPRKTSSIATAVAVQPNTRRVAQSPRQLADKPQMSSAKLPGTTDRTAATPNSNKPESLSSRIPPLELSLSRQGSEIDFSIPDHPPAETTAIRQARLAKERLAAELAELRRREAALNRRPSEPAIPQIAVPPSLVSPRHGRRQSTIVLDPDDERLSVANRSPAAVSSPRRRNNGPDGGESGEIPQARSARSGRSPSPVITVSPREVARTERTSTRITWEVDVDVVESISAVVRDGAELNVKFRDRAACAMFAAHVEMLRDGARA
ncbi:hypothetical protein J8273_8535 [Carpediemonas membranifera]|uniref:Uncharacterized protein n=1 Tax=Carpediemonas membranifera TaxID=201153 RepID=A0A8J6BU10_9EUKA|nr:hypothetical protein J8273_8535 [Carpediemonas membranifera]|eukprot:KAG9389856.1 hypothetical protein J8273_8535 [Carpediemonas membranifera]